MNLHCKHDFRSVFLRLATLWAIHLHSQPKTCTCSGPFPETVFGPTGGHRPPSPRFDTSLIRFAPFGKWTSETGETAPPFPPDTHTRNVMVFRSVCSHLDTLWPMNLHFPHSKRENMIHFFPSGFAVRNEFAMQVRLLVRIFPSGHAVGDEIERVFKIMCTLN